MTTEPEGRNWVRDEDSSINQGDIIILQKHPPQTWMIYNNKVWLLLGALYHLWVDFNSFLFSRTQPSWTTSEQNIVYHYGEGTEDVIKYEWGLKTSACNTQNLCPWSKQITSSNFWGVRKWDALLRKESKLLVNKNSLPRLPSQTRNI